MGVRVKASWRTGWLFLLAALIATVIVWIEASGREARSTTAAPGAGRVAAPPPGAREAPHPALGQPTDGTSYTVELEAVDGR